MQWQDLFTIYMIGYALVYIITMFYHSYSLAKEKYPTDDQILQTIFIPVITGLLSWLILIPLVIVVIIQYITKKD